MLRFAVLSVLRVRSCAFWMKTADAWYAVAELPCPAMADCAVRIGRVAVWRVCAKHRFHLTFWTSFYDCPSCYQAWELHCCLFKQSSRSPRFGKQDHLPTYWRGVVGNKDKVNTIAAFCVKWNNRTWSWCFSGLGLRREVYVVVKSDSDHLDLKFGLKVMISGFFCATSQSKCCVLWFKQSCRILIFSLQTAVFLWITALLNTAGK